jgi:hypothetical protein
VNVVIALMGVAIVVCAKPLAQVGETSGAVLLGETPTPPPAKEDAWLRWVIRLTGFLMLFLGWLA